MKYLVFLSILLILALATIGNAFYHQKQYYPSIVYLTKSNASMAVTYFISSNIMWLFGYWLIYIFFGELRPAENEELWERLKYVATETLMAFAIFRDDFSPHFAMLFAVLLYVKIMHWLGEERVDYLERSPVLPKLFHVRIFSLLTLLGMLDVSLMSLSCKSVLMFGPSPHIAFGFEYAILLPSIFYIVLKYILHTTEIRREAPLEDKAIILVYGQIAFDFLKIILYFSYLAVMFRLYLLPAFAFRQIFNTMRHFASAINDVVSFRKAVRYMNKFCPSATLEELEATDLVCIVCREDMRSGAKKLPCNHIFHGACLRSWFQRQQTCPTCRLKILSPLIRVTVNQEVQQNRQIQPQVNQIQTESAQQESGQITTRTNLELPGSEIQQQMYQNQQGNEFKQYTSLNATLSLTCIQQRRSSTTSDMSTTTVSSEPSDSAQSSIKLRHNDSLSQLSCQDLIAMERDTRVGIQNRIKYLQHMSKMLDSTLVMMHQYYNETAESSRSAVQLSSHDSHRESSSNTNIAEEQEEDSEESSGSRSTGALEIEE